MKKLMLIIAIVFSGMLMQAQSHTFSNNMGTNYMNGKTGNLKKSSISWTFKNSSNGIYSITATYAGTFKVKYSHYDSTNKLYVYVPIGSAKFDGAKINQVMSAGKLSDYANGIAPRGKNVFGVVFTDNTGYLYTLSN